MNYCLFEEETHRYASNDYYWEINRNGNLIGKEINSGKHVFTWQPHGSQFTIHEDIPLNAIKFSLEKPPVINSDVILDSIGFDSSWVKIFR